MYTYSNGINSINRHISLDNQLILRYLGKEEFNINNRKIQTLFIDILNARRNAARSGNSEFEFTIDYQYHDRSLRKVALFFRKLFDMEIREESSATKPCSIISNKTNPYLNLPEEAFKCINSPNQKKYKDNINELEKLFHEAVAESGKKMTNDFFSQMPSLMLRILQNFKGSEAIFEKTVKIWQVLEVETLQFMILFFKKLDIRVFETELAETRSKFILKGHVNSLTFDKYTDKPSFFTPNVVKLDFDPTRFSDISFLVEGKEIKMHRIMLLNAPFFAGMLNDCWKECRSNEPIPFESGSYRAFLELKNFLYLKEVSFECLNDFHFCLELYALAKFVQIPYLQELTLNAISNCDNHEYFIDLALTANEIADSDLKELCLWLSYETKKSEYDLSGCSQENLLSLEKIAKFYNHKGLEKSVKEEFDKRNPPVCAYFQQGSHFQENLQPHKS